MGIQPSTANMKVLLFSFFLGLALAFPEDEYARVQFAKFKMEHQKVCKTRAEHESRFQVFAENLKKIAAHNNAGHSYTLGINKFSDLNHAVLVVGYGRQSGQDYWLIKNSWGRSWGENGFVKVKKGTGHCGVGSLHQTVPTCA